MTVFHMLGFTINALGQYCQILMISNHVLSSILIRALNYLDTSVLGNIKNIKSNMICHC
jgi:hypothetical protein